MSTLAERIQSRMEELGLTQEQLAKLADISQTAVHKLTTGKSRETRKLAQLARALRVDINWLSTGQDIHPIEGEALRPAPISNVEPGPDIRGRVPLISWVRAGEWCGAVDNYAPGDGEEWRETTAKVGKHAYALRVKGDSMTNPHGAPSIPEGCIVIVDPEAPHGNGSIIVARLESGQEVTLKRLVEDGGKRYLKALNPAYQVIEISAECVICGVVKQIVFDL